MTAPNIEMIADSLRNCSLGRRSTVAGLPAVRSQQPQRRGEESVEVTVELNSEVALPYHWEQCLDMRVGNLTSPPSLSLFLKCPCSFLLFFFVQSLIINATIQVSKSNLFRFFDDGSLLYLALFMETG